MTERITECPGCRARCRVGYCSNHHSEHEQVPVPDTRIKDEYLAANGHLMVTVEWRTNRTGSPVRVQWNAEHSPNCACGGREALPDW